MAEERAVFEAVFPSTQSAIRVHGDAGMRIELDIDESNVPRALDVMLWRNRRLKITVEPVSDGPDRPRKIHI